MINLQTPDIFQARCYFWTPGASASQRRRNEDRRNAEAQEWIDQNAEALKAGGFVIQFSYSESCHNVYKRVVVTRNGKRSNLLAVKNWLAKHQPMTT